MEVEVRVMQLLALNMEGGFKPRSTKELASRRWKRQGNRFALRASRRNTALDALILTCETHFGFLTYRIIR